MTLVKGYDTIKRSLRRKKRLWGQKSGWGRNSGKKCARGGTGPRGIQNNGFYGSTCLHATGSSLGATTTRLTLPACLAAASCSRLPISLSYCRDGQQIVPDPDPDPDPDPERGSSGFGSGWRKTDGQQTCRTLTLTWRQLHLLFSLLKERREDAAASQYPNFCHVPLIILQCFPSILVPNNAAVSCLSYHYAMVSEHLSAFQHGQIPAHEVRELNELLLHLLKAKSREAQHWFLMYKLTGSLSFMKK